MMQIVLPRSWKDEFAVAVAAKREDILYKEKSIRFEEGRRKRREEDRNEGQRDEADSLDAMETVLATSEEIIEFRSQLDTYDAKTVEALMDNQQAIETARRRIDDMLTEAHVLPDGRRVFKTMDGQHVFDEHGEELSLDMVDPSGIDDKKPRWETFKAGTVEYSRLIQERQQLFEYQAKLDEARERLDKGDITQKELYTIKADLSATMPDAIREKLGLEKSDTHQAPQPESAEPTLPSNMDSLMLQTGRGPKGLTPA